MTIRGDDVTMDGSARYLLCDFGRGLPPVVSRLRGMSSLDGRRLQTKEKTSVRDKSDSAAMSGAGRPQRVLASLYLTGPFRIEDADGRDLTPRSRRAQALLAMLCLAPRGQRSRLWLRDKLWSDRDDVQGSASLRQEILIIRKALGVIAADILLVDRLTMALALQHVRIISEPGHTGDDGHPAEEFLEGMDIRDEEFEEWLRLERQNRLAAAAAVSAPRAAELRPGLVETAGAHPPRDEPRLRERWRVLLMPPPGVGQSGTPALAAAAVMGMLRTGLIETGDVDVVEPSGGIGHLSEIATDPSMAATLVLQSQLTWDDRQLALRLQLKSRATGSLVWSGQCMVTASDVINGKSADLFRLVSQAFDETLGYFVRIDRERALAENRLFTAISSMFQLDRRHLDRAEQTLRARLGNEFGKTETYAWLAFLMTFRVGQRFNADDRPVVEEAQMFARKALESGRGSAIVNALVGHVHSYLFGEYDLASSLFADSLRIQPENLMALDLAATLNVYTGRVDEALALAHRAQAIGRYSPNRFYFETTIALASAFAGDYRTAITTARSALALRPGFNSLLRIMVASHGHLDDREAARAYHARLLTTEPSFSIGYLRDIGYPGLNTEAGRVFLDGLRRAGVR